MPCLLSQIEPMGHDPPERILDDVRILLAQTREPVPSGLHDCSEYLGDAIIKRLLVPPGALHGYRWPQQ